jgi:hypothetical protein
MPREGNWRVAPQLGVRDVLKTVAYFESVLGFDFGPNGVHRGIGDEGAIYAEDSAYGLRDFVVQTPDGHRIGFGSPPA